MFRQRKLLLSFLIILTIVITNGCDDEIINPDISEDEIIGTWVLTKIIVSYPIGQKEQSPTEENLALTITLKNDKSYLRSQNNKGQITKDAGTWSITHGLLSLTSDSKTFTFPCRLNENILQVAATVVDPNSGFMIPIRLEFSKNFDY